MIKHLGHNQLVEERVALMLQLHQLRRKGRKSREEPQELKQQPRRNAAFYLAPLVLLSFLSYTSEDHLPRVARPTDGESLPYQPLIKKMPQRLDKHLVLLKHILSKDSLF